MKKTYKRPVALIITLGTTPLLGAFSMTLGGDPNVDTGGLKNPSSRYRNKLWDDDDEDW